MGSAERPEPELWSARRDGAAIRLAGAVDAYTADAVTKRLVAEVLAGAGEIDLREVEYFGAAGVRAVLAGRDAAAQRGATLLLRCPPLVARVIELCSLDELQGCRVVRQEADDPG